MTFPNFVNILFRISAASFNKPVTYQFSTIS